MPDVDVAHPIYPGHPTPRGATHPVTRSPLDIDVEGRPHHTDGEIFEIEAVDSVGVSTQRNERYADVIQYEIACAGERWEELVDPGAQLAAGGGTRLLAITRKRGYRSLPSQHEMLANALREAIRALADVERDRRLRGQTKPFVIEDDRDWAAARAVEGERT